jgi:inner membrane protein
MRQSILKQSMVLRVLTAGFLCLFLLIPVALVRGLIDERQARRDEAVREVTEKWGEAQTLIGPVLSVPLRRAVTTDKGRIVYESTLVHCLPDALDISATLTPEIRYRGIYKVVVYSARLSIGASFLPADLKSYENEDRHLQWEEAFLTLGFSDLKGLKDIEEVTWNEQPLSLNPGVRVSDLFSTGITISPDRISEGPAELRMTADLNGSEQLQIVPVGKVTNFHASADWSDPSFIGGFLPAQRRVTESGFTADWRVLHLSRNFPQNWTGARQDLSSSAFGVRLLVPIDEYQKNSRAAKYAIMFIALMFLAFGMTDVLARVAFHPIHYGLVTLALLLFYVLLLSLSEQVGFNWGYALACGAILALVTVYLFGTTGRASVTTALAGLLAVQYAFLFVLMQLEDYALLVGSLGLFVILALVMYLTRKIDWFNLGEAEPGQASERGLTDH